MPYEVRREGSIEIKEVAQTLDHALHVAGGLSRASEGWLRWLVLDAKSTRVRAFFSHGRMSWALECRACKGAGGWCGTCVGLGYVAADTP